MTLKSAEFTKEPSAQYLNLTNLIQIKMEKSIKKKTPGAFGKNGKTLPQNSLELKSKKRMETLANNLFEAIEKTSKEVEGELTVSEMLDVMLRIGHNFNKRALLSEFENEAIVVDMTPKTDA